MKICVLMWYDSSITIFAEINYKINKLYCEKHGYDIIKSDKRNYKDRPTHWERLPLVLQNIDNYDYVVWIDADAFFYIDSPPITDVISAYPNVNLILSADEFQRRDWHINSGFFIVKNNKKSIDIITEWGFSNDLMERRYGFNDQGVIRLMYDENILNLKNESVVLPYGFLQHFNPWELKDLPSKPYIRHLAGKPRTQRIITSSNYYKQITRNTN